MFHSHCDDDADYYRLDTAKPPLAFTTFIDSHKWGSARWALLRMDLVMTTVIMMMIIMITMMMIHCVVVMMILVYIVNYDDFLFVQTTSSTVTGVSDDHFIAPLPPSL